MNQRSNEHGRAPESTREGPETRRNRIARSPNRSPWDIGKAHYNQRDTYTTNNRTDDTGYAEGPHVHPEIGSYAYPRSEHIAEQLRAESPSIYEREAWPWLNYEAEQREPAAQPGVLERVKDLFVNDNEVAPPSSSRVRDDKEIYGEVRTALAMRADVDSADIAVKVENGVVTLEGTARDRHSIKLAEEIAEGTVGVAEVKNRIELRKEDGDDDDTAFVMPVLVV